MRCLILGALVVIASTGCGGPSGDPRPELRQESAARSKADEAVIRMYSAKFSADAVETCVRAFDDDNLQEHAQVNKPRSADLADFLCSCVGASPCL